MGNVGLYISTVLGFFSVLMFAIVMFIHYLRLGLDSKSSITIDPKPENTYTEN